MSFKLLFISLLMMFISTDYEDSIIWSDNVKLTWDYFKGQKNIETDAVAVTASGITFAYKVKKANGKIIDFTTTVEAHFYPSKSWVIKKLADEYILAHEQLHFDITELHVRKLKKQIGAVKASQKLGDELDRLHQNINKELAAMQNQYDSESNNSINKDAQAKWSLYVAKELKKLEAFKLK